MSAQVRRVVGGDYLLRGPGGTDDDRLYLDGSPGAPLRIDYRFIGSGSASPITFSTIAGQSITVAPNTRSSIVVEGVGGRYFPQIAPWPEGPRPALRRLTANERKAWDNPIAENVLVRNDAPVMMPAFGPLDDRGPLVFGVTWAEQSAQPGTYIFTLQAGDE